MTWAPQTLSLLSLTLSFVLPLARPLAPPDAMTRVAVVTGANKGIGYHVAERLAGSGLFSDVVLGCRDERRGAAAVEDIRSSGRADGSCRVVCWQLTIGDRNSHDAFVRYVDEAFGKVDVLVNNAGECEDLVHWFWRRIDLTNFKFFTIHFPTHVMCSTDEKMQVWHLRGGIRRRSNSSAGRPSP